MQWETYIKRGRHWQYIGEVNAVSSLTAARQAYRLYRCKRVKLGFGSHIFAQYHFTKKQPGSNNHEQTAKNLSTKGRHT